MLDTTLPEWDVMRNVDTPLGSVLRSFELAIHDLSPKTRAWYLDQLRRYAAWLEKAGKEVTVRSITPDLVNAYIAERKLVSAHSARASAASLKVFASWLARTGIHRTRAGDSVLRHVRTPRPKPGVPKALTDEDLARVMKVAQEGDNPARDFAIVTLMVGCGLRLAEACGLHIEDIDWQQGLIHVSAETAKGGKARTVRLDAIAAQAIDRYIADFRHAEDGVLFLTNDRQPFKLGGFGKVFYRICQRSGLDRFHAHMLRHTWATNFRRVGAGDLFDLQEEGGWSDLTMPRRYAAPRPVRERTRTTPLASLLTLSVTRESVSHRANQITNGRRQGIGRMG